MPTKTAPKFKKGDHVRYIGKTYTERTRNGRTGVIEHGPKTARGRNYHVLFDGDDGETFNQRSIVLYAEDLEPA